MDPAIFQVLALLVVALLLFASELVAVDIVAICLLLFLVGSDLLDISSALAGFGHPAVVGVGALFVVSEGLLRTGALGFLSNRLLKWSGGHQGLLTILILIIVLIASAFLNNTPVVAMFIDDALEQIVLVSQMLAGVVLRRFGPLRRQASSTAVRTKQQHDASKREKPQRRRHPRHLRHAFRDLRHRRRQHRQSDHEDHNEQRAGG